MKVIERERQQIVNTNMKVIEQYREKRCEEEPAVLFRVETDN